MASKTEKMKDLPGTAEVEIEHPKTGERYGVTVAAFRDHYEGAGFKIDRMGDGSAILSDRDEAKRPDDVQLFGPQGDPQPVDPTPKVAEVPPDAD